METSRISEVKAPQHDGTPRAHGGLAEVVLGRIIHRTGTAGLLFLEPEEVVKLVSKSKAFVHAGIEDFGIAPVEAQSCGTPVIAYNKGGLSETVIDKKTGILFNSQSTDAILHALKRFKEVDFDYSKISEHAGQFSEENFAKNFQNFIDSKIKE